jgi:hypothetical protein
VNLERSDFTRTPAIERCTHSQSAQNRTVCPARGTPSQNWLPHRLMFPDAGTTLSNSTASPDGPAASASAGAGSTGGAQAGSTA